MAVVSSQTPLKKRKAGVRYTCFDPSFFRKVFNLKIKPPTARILQGLRRFWTMILTAHRRISVKIPPRCEIHYGSDHACNFSSTYFSHLLTNPTTICIILQEASQKNCAFKLNTLRNFGGRRFWMESVSKWLLTDAEKDSFVATLTPHLAILRTQAEVSQEELANLIGVSRQTYSAIERKIRKMSWNTYLSLVLFYDHNQKTHQLLRHLSLFPTELVVRFNEGVDFSSFELSEFLGEKMQDIVDRLDDQALQTVRQTIMAEYARCTKLPDSAVVKSFDGTPIATETATERDIKALNAIRAIIADSEKNGQ